MGHSELIDILLQIHAAVFVTSLAAFYAYSDRTDGFTSSLAGTTEVLRELRRRIVRTLEEKLKPIFESPGSVPSPVLGPHGSTYVEHPVNPVGSEIYRETLREFLEERVESICDYHALLFACRRWCFWTGALRNLLLALFSWQALVCVLLFVDKASKFDCPMWILCAVTTITVIAFVAAVSIIVLRLLHYRIVTELRLKHGEL